MTAVKLLTTIPKQQRITYVASHLEKFDTDEIKKYLITTLESVDTLTTELRKFLKIFDYYHPKNKKSPNKGGDQ